MGVIVQEAFYIPDNIALGLAKGIYKRFGGVVRWAVGHAKVTQHFGDTTFG